MKKYALIVAGGKGERMGSETPKQFLPVAGKPLLMHTLQVFHATDPSIELILVLPELHFATWGNLCEEYNFEVMHQVVNGGSMRFESVYNGLQSIDGDEGLVAIHDGVRPLVTSRIITETYRVAGENGNAVAAVRSKDSLRLVVDGVSRAVNREDYYLVQTPQTFRLSGIRKAYASAAHNRFTDDAAVAEAHGETIRLVEGDYRNIKITTPEDLLLAELLISRG